MSISDRESATPSQNNVTLPQKQNIFDPIQLDPPVFPNPPSRLALQTSTDLGVYLYDIISISSRLKLLAGLRETGDRGTMA